MRLPERPGRAIRNADLRRRAQESPTSPKDGFMRLPEGLGKTKRNASLRCREEHDSHAA